MSMKVTRVPTWWDAEQADTVIAFLDELRDQLCATYGDQIITMRRAELKESEADERQGELELKGGSMDF
jgi:hypothetical protein